MTSSAPPIYANAPPLAEAPVPSATAKPILPSRVPRSTIALLFISILLPLVLFALATMQNRRDVVHAAERRVERTTRILHEHALKVFETHQLMIDQINERLSTLDWNNPEERRRLHDLLSHLQALFPQVAAIVVSDASGTVIASSLNEPGASSVNVAGRDYFKALRVKDQALPYISRAMLGRRTGEPIFSMASRVRTSTPGTFAGVVAIAIDQAYFDDFYRDTEREYEHLIILARTDGSVLASEPAHMGNLPLVPLDQLDLGGRPNNFLMRATVVNGEQRLFGYEKVGTYPVVIGFGVGLGTAMMPWRRNMWTYGLVAALSSLALLGVSGIAIRRIALEGRATRRWRKSAALLETEIAERARIEGQLRQAQKMEAVGRLTGGIAHDFNNLLTVVVGSLDLLSRRIGDGDPRQKALIGNAIDGATRAATLTARLLAFSRQHPLDAKAIDANALVEGMHNLLQRTLGETVSIELDLAAELWPVFADPNQLENAVLNLCVNAVDAMPKGGSVTVKTANAMLDATSRSLNADLAPGPYVMIAVTDTGTGMTPDVLAKAFEPFFTTKPVGKGTGLGLSQVYGFARQSSGHAAIDTEPGQGTTIKIFLPRPSTAQTPRHEIVPVSAQPDPVRSASGGSATVLIVEDDELVRQFSSAALRDTGYNVLEAGTGPDGLRLLGANPEIMLLFTDIVLKGPFDGHELAKQALVLRPGLPILFTSGYTKDAVTPVGRLGADSSADFLAKPFTTAVLAAKIANLLGIGSEPVVERRSAVG